MNNNPVLALMENDSPDKFAKDVANAYFANPAHVRRILNEDCIESCVQYVLDNQQVEFDLSDLALFNEDDPFFSKPSRAKRGRKKSNRNNKKSKADRFHGSRKSYWKHQYKKWGANERRSALDRNGFGAVHASHRIHTEGAMPVSFVHDTDDNNLTLTCNCKDGNTLSCTMSMETWLAPIWDETEQKSTAAMSDWVEVEEREEIPAFNIFTEDDEYTDPDSYEDDYDEDDEIIEIEEDDYVPSCEFTAIEMADMSMKMATATAKQRAKIREFFRSL